MSRSEKEEIFLWFGYTKNGDRKIGAGILSVYVKVREELGAGQMDTAVVFSKLTGVICCEWITLITCT